MQPGITSVKGDKRMNRPIAAVALDRVLGASRPTLATEANVRDFERTPLGERLAATNTLSALQIGAALDPAAPAIQFLAEADPAETPMVLSHREFIASVIRAANAFTASGVGPTDTVSLLLPLVPQSFYALYGAQAAGIANPINPFLEAGQIEGILRAARTRVLVTLGPAAGSDIWSKVAQIRERLPDLQTVLVVGTQPPAAPGLRDFDRLLAEQRDDDLISGRTIAADDRAAYFHTGGTTGTPKLVAHTHRNHVYQAWAVNLMLPCPPGDPLLFGLPLFHVGGALTQGLASLSRGGSLVVVSAAGWRNPNAVRNVWRLVQRYRPTTLSGVPTVLAAALGVPIDGADVSSLKVASGGGSAIPVAIGSQLQSRLGVPVLEVYGMTETASVHTIAYRDRPLRLGSAGHPIPYSRVRIVRIDADGRYAGDCETDEIGVVAMSGPGVFSGYLDEAHNRGAFIEPGWVNSGDLGRLDAEGYLWITGRAKDLIIRGGHNIDPAVVEEALYRHPDVALAGVVGQPDAAVGEKPVAYVQLKAGATVSGDVLLEHVRERTNERAAVPVAVHVIESFPLTGVGKVFKPALRWDAARRVFEAILAPLADNGVAITVSVGSHGTHGSIATLTIAAPSARRQGIAAGVEARLAPFTLAHAIVWVEVDDGRT